MWLRKVHYLILQVCYVWCLEKDGVQLHKKYFLALEEGINTLPGFAPEIQGVYLQKKDPDGRTRAYGYVLTDY